MRLLLRLHMALFGRMTGRAYIRVVPPIVVVAVIAAGAYAGWWLAGWWLLAPWLAVTVRPMLRAAQLALNGSIVERLINRAGMNYADQLAAHVPTLAGVESQMATTILYQALAEIPMRDVPTFFEWCIEHDIGEADDLDMTLLDAPPQVRRVFDRVARNGHREEPWWDR